MLPGKLDQDNFIALIRQWQDMWNNVLMDHLQSMRLVAGPRIRIQRYPTGTVISLVEQPKSSRAGAASSGGDTSKFYPFEVTYDKTTRLFSVSNASFMANGIVARYSDFSASISRDEVEKGRSFRFQNGSEYHSGYAICLYTTDSATGSGTTDAFYNPSTGPQGDASASLSASYNLSSYGHSTVHPEQNGPFVIVAFAIYMDGGNYLVQNFDAIPNVPIRTECPLCL